MKKTGTLNAQLSRVLAELGHGDFIVIADCGLPIPSGVERVDLALTQGVPSFTQTMEVILSEMQVEYIVFASEAHEHNPELIEMAERLTQNGAESREVGHEAFKVLTRQARAVIRTGEATPYANMILYSGVVF